MQLEYSRIYSQYTVLHLPVKAYFMFSSSPFFMSSSTILNGILRVSTASKAKMWQDTNLVKYKMHTASLVLHCKSRLHYSLSVNSVNYDHKS